MAGALRAAAVDFYGHSWRLALLNTAFTILVLPLLVLSLWAPVLLVPAVLGAGPLAMALMHCAVTLAQTEDLRLRCAAAGLRLHWRRGLVLAAAGGLVVAAGVVAASTYGGWGSWVLVTLVVYVLAAAAVVQLCVWPLAVAERTVPLSRVVRAALEIALRRPFQTLALALALLVTNALGAAAALMPLFTLTIAYSFLAAAHYVLPRNPLGEAGSWPE